MGEDKLIETLYRKCEKKENSNSPEINKLLNKFNTICENIALLLPEDKKYLLFQLDEVNGKITSFAESEMYKCGFKDAIKVMNVK